MSKFAMVVSGPSGSGKSTLLNLYDILMTCSLFAKFPSTFGFSVSHTTRQPRKGEVDKVNYHFCKKEEFMNLKESGGFVETAEFSGKNCIDKGNLYGTSLEAIEAVDASGKICVLDLEAKGVQAIRKKGINAKFIFIQPPSVEELGKRLRGRGTETEESLQARLDSAQEAFDLAALPGSYDLVLINDNQEDAYKKLEEYVKTTWGL